MAAADSDAEDGAPKLARGRLYPLGPPRALPPILTYAGLHVHTYEDGSSYAGDWVRGMRSGWGVFTTPDGCRYAGEWRTDRHEGLGVARYPSGNRYEGEFRANTRHGRGLFLWKTTVSKRARMRGVRGVCARASMRVFTLHAHALCALRSPSPLIRARRTSGGGTWTCARAWARTCGRTAPSTRASGRTACSTAAAATTGQTVSALLGACACARVLHARTRRACNAGLARCARVPARCARAAHVTATRALIRPCALTPCSLALRSPRQAASTRATSRWGGGAARASRPTPTGASSAGAPGRAGSWCVR
jgi:hypothetical protein